MAKPNHYVLVVPPLWARVIVAGLGKLPGEAMFDVTTDLKRQMADQDAAAEARALAAEEPTPLADAVG